MKVLMVGLCFGNLLVTRFLNMKFFDFRLLEWYIYDVNCVFVVENGKGMKLCIFFFWPK